MKEQTLYLTIKKGARGKSDESQAILLANKWLSIFVDGFHQTTFGSWWLFISYSPWVEWATMKAMDKYIMDLRGDTSQWSIWIISFLDPLFSKHPSSLQVSLKYHNHYCPNEPREAILDSTRITRHQTEDTFFYSHFLNQENHLNNNRNNQSPGVQAK
jgi:hypothetical protein